MPYTDNFAMAPLGDGDCRNFHAVCNDRYRLRSAVLPSHSRRTAADSMLGHLVHDALPFSNARTAARSRMSAGCGNSAHWVRRR